jgi:hypothetical protein
VRALIIALAYASSANANISAPFPIQPPQAVSLRFSKDASVEFTLSEHRVTHLGGRVGRVRIDASFEGCTALTNVQFDTVHLIRNDLRNKDASDSFSMIFDVDEDQAGKYGRLAQVQLSFSGGSMSMAMISWGQNGAVWGELCPGKVPPNNRLERSRGASSVNQGGSR